MSENYLAVLFMNSLHFNFAVETVANCLSETGFLLGQIFLSSTSYIALQCAVSSSAASLWTRRSLLCANRHRIFGVMCCVELKS